MDCLLIYNYIYIIENRFRLILQTRNTAEGKARTIVNCLYTDTMKNFFGCIGKRRNEWCSVLAWFLIVDFWFERVITSVCYGVC